MPATPRRTRRGAAALVAAALSAALLSACGNRNRPFAELRLPLPIPAPGKPPRLWLWPGESIRWQIPAGPAGRVRIRFHHPLAWEPGGRETLVARVAAPPSVSSSTIDLPSGADAEPRTRTIAFPASARERLLTIEMEPAEASPRPILLADVVLEWPRRVDGEPRVIVLLDIDTLRADHLSLYGYPKPTSPAIDRTFGPGLVADRCFSNATWTLPSHASMFTSTLVSRHQVRTPADRLPENFPLLAELLRKAGYSTFGVTNGGYVDAEYGFSRGFDRYDSSDESIEDEVARALADLDAAPGSRVFLFLHTYQVHNYAPSTRSASEMFGSAAALGSGWMDLIRKQLESADGSAAERREWARRRYDASIRRVDDAFAALVAGITERGLWNHTAVVLASDHGEALFDRRETSPDAPPYFGHPLPHLYDPEIRVPFAVRAPGKKWSGRIAAPVSMLDLAPTILDLADVPAPRTFEGASLSAPRPGVLFAASPTYDAVAVRDGPHKIIVRPDFRQISWEANAYHDLLPARECFSLDRDPEEKSPVPCDAPWAAALAADADRYIATSYPRSIVLRLSGSAQAPCRVAAEAAAAPPQARSFALRPAARVRTSGTVRSVRLPLGRSPVWLAFRPRELGDGLSIGLEGCGPLRDPRNREVAGAMAATWSELVWRARRPLPEGNVIFAVPPLLEPDRTRGGPVSGGLVRRLQALGYLSAGSGAAFPTAPIEDEEPTGLPPVRPGEVQVRQR